MTDRIYLYLLHWRGNVPFAETLEALMRALVRIHPFKSLHTHFRVLARR